MIHGLHHVNYSIIIFWRFIKLSLRFGKILAYLQFVETSLSLLKSAYLTSKNCYAVGEWLTLS
uniref:Uncharacterized protein n=1 Tax=Arundo donax TaxID=35708 RepID=A0A0A9HQT6_ARUDO